MFRPYKVIIRPSKKTDPRAVLYFTALWDPLYLHAFVTECKVHKLVYIALRLKFNIQGVTGGTDQTSGGCSLCETIPKKPKTPISKVERFGR